jgi:hypothetical protein
MAETILKQIKNITLTMLNNLLDRNCNYSLVDSNGELLACILHEYSAIADSLKIKYILSDRKDISIANRTIKVVMRRYINADIEHMQLISNIPEKILNNENWIVDDIIKYLELSAYISEIDCCMRIISPAYMDSKEYGLKYDNTFYDYYEIYHKYARARCMIYKNIKLINRVNRLYGDNICKCIINPSCYPDVDMQNIFYKSYDIV